MAYVALAHEGGVLREVGISRYSASEDLGQCECAITVADDWQGRGLAVMLMRHLIERARKYGFKGMFSVDSVHNLPMRELADYLGFTRTVDPLDATQAFHHLAL